MLELRLDRRNSNIAPDHLSSKNQREAINENTWNQRLWRSSGQRRERPRGEVAGMSCAGDYEVILARTLSSTTQGAARFRDSLDAVSYLVGLRGAARRYGRAQRLARARRFRSPFTKERVDE